MNKKSAKILLLENIHEKAAEYFRDNGFKNIKQYNQALLDEELKSEIKDAYFIGIRSKTKLTQEVLRVAENLQAIGAFCIGTNQIELEFAKQQGVPVFNAPFSNTRSVAELIIGEIIMLARGIPEKNTLAHQGAWQKSADNSFEVRGKNLGIVGYGKIGFQVSVLAESLGMNVYYYDIEKRLNLGQAKTCATLAELLSNVDFVTLHVPETKTTKNMIGAKELAQMRAGSYLINASRGTVVDIQALAQALRNGHLAGAAIDVFPEEPASNKDPFTSELQGINNCLLTPHIGGSTLEAQANIALEVSEHLASFFESGNTMGAVNFVEISLPFTNQHCQRFLHIHQNVPGVMKNINNIFSSRDLNVAGQYLRSDAEIGYVIIDVDEVKEPEKIIEELSKVPNTIKARLIR